MCIFKKNKGNLSEKKKVWMKEEREFVRTKRRKNFQRKWTWMKKIDGRTKKGRKVSV